MPRSRPIIAAVLAAVALTACDPAPPQAPPTPAVAAEQSESPREAACDKIKKVSYEMVATSRAIGAARSDGTKVEAAVAQFTGTLDNLTAVLTPIASDLEDEKVTPAVYALLDAIVKLQRGLPDVGDDPGRLAALLDKSSFYQAMQKLGDICRS